MAQGIGRLTGEPGLVIATSGPGANLATVSNCDCRRGPCFSIGRTGKTVRFVKINSPKHE